MMTHRGIVTQEQRGHGSLCPCGVLGMRGILPTVS